MSEIYGTFSTAYVEAMRLRLSALEPENKNLRARVAELERDLEQAKADRARAAMDARNPLMAQLAELEARCKRLEDALNNVELVMQRPASNHRMMQIAEPARRVLNIIKRTKEESHE